jgi:DNA-binding MarR family transcriptional regulator
VAGKTDDDVLLDGLRLAVGISIRAADELDDLSPVQLRALTVLRENPRSNLVALAEAMGVTVSTASRLVDRLVAARLATRKPSDRTRREVTLGLTRAGRTTLQRYDRLRLESLRACLEHVRPQAMEALLTALREVMTALPRVSESPRPA